MRRERDRCGDSKGNLEYSRSSSAGNVPNYNVSGCGNNLSRRRALSLQLIPIAEYADDFIRIMRPNKLAAPTEIVSWLQIFPKAWRKRK
mmetsp:Transcript_6498/g.9066  ORF Transcript_6498/g.9066 Transcript_6498/m.9066 type:complete len:89 (-) Transcript_6498:225-491(-)